MKNFSQTESISWAEFEFGQAQLVDKRLNQRLVKIANDFLQQPTASITQATGSAAQAQRTYDFFKNKFIEPEQILKPHLNRTLQRCSENKFVLMINDTSYLDFTTQPDKKGLGPLATQNSAGMLIHPILASTTDGVPLGIADIQVWTRSKDEFGKSNNRQKRATDEKESQKWLNSYLKTITFGPLKMTRHKMSKRSRGCF
jgi:hypothetical protein